MYFIGISENESDLDFNSSESNSDSDDDLVVHEPNDVESTLNIVESNQPLIDDNDIASSSHGIESTDSHGNKFSLSEYECKNLFFNISVLIIINIGNEDVLRSDVDDLIAHLSNASPKTSSRNSKISSDVLRKLLQRIRNHINTGVFETKEKNNGKKRRMSDVWKMFHIIMLKNTNRKIPNVNWCTACNEVVFNLAHDGGTNYLRRHKC